MATTSHPDTEHPRDHAARLGERTSWAPLALLLAAQFMVILDISIVNVALPSIGRALDFSGADLQWVLTAYVICSGGLVLLGGRAADFWGGRRVFLYGLLAFSAASLASGISTSPAMLVTARACQGTAAAMLTPAALSLLTTIYTGGQRATALSIWGGVGGAGIAVGVALGGVLTTLLSWHWIFLVNVPVGLAAALAVPRLLPARTASPARPSLDPLGAATLVGGLGVLVYALAGTTQYGWGSSRSLLLLALSAVLLAGFAVVERRVREPLVPRALWRGRALLTGTGLMLGTTGVLAGSFFLVSVYAQESLGLSALQAGLGFLPFVAATGLGMHLVRHLVGHVGTRVPIAFGIALAGLAAGLLAALNGHGYAVGLLPGLLVLGFGLGLAFPAISIAALSETEADRAGVSSGVLSAGHEIGAALGTAVLSAVAQASGGGWDFGAAFLAAAIVAAALSAIAAGLAPAVRPEPGTRVALH